MGEPSKLREIGPGDCRVAGVIEELSTFQDAIGALSTAERNQLRGKVIAILNESGEIIAVADTSEELQEAVRKSEYVGKPWRLVDGPTT